LKKRLGNTILKIANHHRLRLIFLLLITLIFPTLPLHAQDQANLDRILAAYNQKSTWQTYSSHTTTNLESALTLITDPNAPQFATLEVLTDQFDGAYIPELRATDGDYTSTSTRTAWSGIDPTLNTTTHNEFAIIALDSQIYLSGHRTVSDNLSDETSIPATLDDFTLLSPDLAIILNDPQIDRLADYNTFPILENIQSLLENATQVIDLGLQSPPDSETNDLAQTYQLNVDPTDGITAFNLDIDRLLNNPNIPSTFNRDAFYDQLATTATMTLTTYLNPNTDELISQHIALSADIQLSDRDVSRPNAAFQLAFTYHHTESFTNINIPFEFELPIVAQ
jgi:hypothetical protein